jgi:predicted nucleotidyltransferase
MDISTDHLIIIKSILKNHLPVEATVYVFGSRARGGAKPFSDLDLAIDADGKVLSLATMAALADHFDESDLPYKVDLVDWNSIDDNFQRLIQSDCQLISR